MGNLKYHFFRIGEMVNKTTAGNDFILKNTTGSILTTGE
jgi:hypothetical protein